MVSVLGEIGMNSGKVDLSTRFKNTTTVVGSPALAAETIIGSLTLLSSIQQATGIELRGWAAYTVGTSGTAVTLKIRRTDTNGSTVASSGALTRAAAALAADTVQGIDTGGVLPGQVYVLTMTVTAGAAASTVSAVYFTATII